MPCPTCGPTPRESSATFVSEMCRSCKLGARVIIHRKQQNGGEYTPADLLYMQRARTAGQTLARLTQDVVEAVQADDIAAAAQLRMEKRAMGPVAQLTKARRWG